jgi:hypothetical protein
MGSPLVSWPQKWTTGTAPNIVDFLDLENSSCRARPKEAHASVGFVAAQLGDEKFLSEHRQLQPPPLQHQQKSSKSEIKHEKCGTYFEVLFASVAASEILLGL